MSLKIKSPMHFGRVNKVYIIPWPFLPSLATVSHTTPHAHKSVRGSLKDEVEASKSSLSALTTALKDKEDVVKTLVRIARFLLPRNPSSRCGVFSLSLRHCLF